MNVVYEEEYDGFVLEMQEGGEALDRRISALEKQVTAAHGILESIEEMEKGIRAFLEAVRPLASRHFVKMRNKKVWFDRENAALFPMFEEVTLPVFDTSSQPAESFQGLDFEGFRFTLMSQGEFRKSFMAGSGNPYLRKDGGFSHFSKDTYDTVILTKEVRGKDSHWCWVNGSDGWYRSGRRVTLVPICRLQGQDSPGMSAMQALHAWLSRGWIPADMDDEMTARYKEFLLLWKSSYLVFQEQEFQLKKASLLRDVLWGRFCRRLFGHALNFPAAMEACKLPEAPVAAARPARRPVPVRNEEEGGQPMDEKRRVPLTLDVLKQGIYPQEVYYDGSAFVDTFISASGNYVKGYVSAGIYRVANVNKGKKTVLLYHKPEFKKIFRKNAVYHSAFETFSVSFSHVFLPEEGAAEDPGREEQKGQEEEAAGIDIEAMMGELKEGQASLERRLSVLEQQMKALRTVKDPVASSPPQRPEAQRHGLSFGQEPFKTPLHF
ncbi:MAG: hypothetical protein IKO94_10265 [Selenomonadaceae bacterium]|nr:hypothetical protein [Selenomonadaceae bacterium]